MNDDHKSRQNIISPSRIDSSTFSDTTTTINTATNTTASEESSLSLSFHPQKSFTEVGGLPSKIISSQVIACAGNISSAVPNNSSLQQHVIITQQQMLQAMHQQIRIKKERQQKHLIVQNNHRTVHTSFSEVHNAQQLIIKRERSASSGLKSPNSSGSVALSHAAIIRQSASPGPMGNVNQMGPMQPPISPHQSISYRHPNSPVPMGSSCGTQKPQVIVKREHASSIHQQQFHLQHQPPSIGRTINVGALSPAGNFTTNNLPTTTSSFASTVGCLSMRNPIRDTALLFRILSPHHTHQQQTQQQQQQHSLHNHQQQQSPQHHPSSSGSNASQTPARMTPTVIMGESCGVRTMVWSYDTTLQKVHNTNSTNTVRSGSTDTDSVSGIATVGSNNAVNNLGTQLQHHPQQQLTHHQHSQNQQNAASTVNNHQQVHPNQTNGGIANTSNSSSSEIIENSNSNNSSHNTVSQNSNNEEAAHLLLSLGQSVVPNTSPTAAAVAVAAAAVVAGHTQSWQGTNHVRTNLPLNMERLWAGDYAQFSSTGSQQQQQALNLTSQQQQQQQNISWSLSGTGSAGGPKKEILDDMPPDDDDQPLVCMICEDKATGLHYGIITCEGCKGFFKRTVQNRRVYTCVADGTCEITKAQRNRCQYCRFKKCIEQGMVLQAVREDRMPGGRNSGAVYNLYKVKYKKHKKSNLKSTTTKLQQGSGAIGAAITNLSDIGVGAGGSLQLGSGIGSVGIAESPKSSNAYQHAHLSTHLQHHHLPSTTSPALVKSESMNLNLMNGTILKTALTNPSEIVHLRHRLDNAVSSSKDRSISYEQALNMIHTLIDCDAMEDIATLPHFSEFLADKSEIGDKLCNIGDSIVHKLVSWTRKLPFYTDIPVEIHTKLLTDKWHEILVLTTAAYQAMHGKKNISVTQTPSAGLVLTPDKNDPEFIEEITAHLNTLQSCLTTLMGHPISIEQLKIDVGQMVEKMTQITIMFRRIKLKMEEYVCLKVYILLNTGN
uniref:Uncharacterized protein n=1 Tax=Anopheles arabiensis TaxID=7173 RepID=A0A182I7N5_ANOAR